MSNRIEISAGLDLHKKFIQAVILFSNGTHLDARYDRDTSGITDLRDWLVENNVEVVACESTSDYWVPVYSLINPKVPVIVGNARDMKVTCHKKTDKLDALNIARLAMNKMVEPSRLFLGEAREYRSMLRLRHRLVQYRTSIKNQIHHILESVQLRLSNVLSDVFGKSGMIILTGIVNGTPVDKIFAKLSPSMAVKLDCFKEKLLEAIPGEVISRLSSCLHILNRMNDDIKDLTKTARGFASSRFARQLQILTSVPGVGEVASLTLLSEFGDVHDFPTAEKFCSWLGLVPEVYQSAGTNHMGHITKRGSPTARWVLDQVVHACNNAKDNALKRFFHKKEVVIGSAKATVALARKIAAILWHLLINDELYDDDIYKSIRMPKNVYVKVPRSTTLEEILTVLSEAHVILKESEGE